MQKDLNVVILDIDGKPMKNEEGKETTVKDAVVSSLKTRLRSDDENSNMFQLFEIAMKVNVKTKCELTAEEIAIIKKRVNSMFFPEVVGRVYEALEK